MCVIPAAIASSTRSAGKVLDTATIVTSLRLRPARSHAARILCSTDARLSAIDTAPLHPPPVRPIHSQVREAIRFLVSRTQRVADREARETAGEPPGSFVQRDEVRVFDAKSSEHLVHQ